MQNIRIFTYLFGLLTIVIFEEPRVSQLLALVFPGEFSRLFSFALPVLVLLIAVVTYSSGDIWKGRTAVFAFSAVLFLSYLNTVLISVREAKSNHTDQIEAVQGKLDSLHIQMNSGKTARQCWAPASSAENYQDLLSGYNACLSASAAESEGIKNQTNSLSAQIKIQIASLENLKKTQPDYIKSITQGAVGILLSVILGIGTGVFCLGLSSEIREIVSSSEQSEIFKIAGLLAEGRSIREIAQELGVSKGTAERTVRKFRTVQAENGIGNTHYAGITYAKKSGTVLGQQWDTSGTVWDSRGTVAGQPQKRTKPTSETDDKNGFLFGSVFDGSGRMA